MACRALADRSRGNPFPRRGVRLNHPGFSIPAVQRVRVPGLSEMVRPPCIFAALLDEGRVDLCQSSFFVGPGAAVSMLRARSYLCRDAYRVGRASRVPIVLRNGY